MSIKDKIENAREDDWLTKDLSEEELNKIKEEVNREKEKIMTIEEAITRLKYWLSNGTEGMTSDRAGYIEGWFVNADVRAFEMAIKALEYMHETEWVEIYEKI